MFICQRSQFQRLCLIDINSLVAFPSFDAVKVKNVIPVWLDYAWPTTDLLFDGLAPCSVIFCSHIMVQSTALRRV